MYLKNSIYIFISFIMSFAVMSSSIAETAYDFSFNTIDGELLPLSDYKGKVLLVVNTASFCGFTPQYEALQSLWSDYKDKGLVVLGVPSNDFMNQEPGSADEIKDFCETNFSIDFPMTEKVVVKGEDAHAFYKWVASKEGANISPKWNFHKYLISTDGSVVDWFASTTKPQSKKIISAIEGALSR